MKLPNLSILGRIRNLSYFRASRSSFLSSALKNGKKHWNTGKKYYLAVPTGLSLSLIGHKFILKKSLCNGLQKVELGNVSDFKEGESKEVKIYNGKDSVLVTNIKGKLYVTGSLCPHFSASFTDGAITDEYLVCPWHNAKFDLKDGSCANGPCFNGIATYEPVVEGDKLYALLPPTPLPVVAVLAMGMDQFAAYVTEAFDRRCMPSYAALKMGAANSQSIMECVNKLKA